MLSSASHQAARRLARSGRHRHFVVCGVPEAKPHAVLVTVKPDCMIVYQEYGDEDRLCSARQIVRWVFEHQRCRVEDEYREDWTDRVAHEGVRVLYPENTRISTRLR